MHVLEKLGEIGAGLVDDVVKKRPFGGLTSAERASLREDIEKVEALLEVDETDLRILVIGPADTSLERLVTELAGEPGDDFEVRQRLGQGRWYEHDLPGGSLHLLDARSDDTAQLRAIEYHPPTAIIALIPAGKVELETEVRDVLDALEWTEMLWGFTPHVVAAIDSPPGTRDVVDFRTQQAFKREMAERGQGRNAIEVVQLSKPGKVVSKVLPELPPSQRYALARLSSNVQTKREVADSIVRLCASVNASIATISLPMASSIPITSIQVLMIAGIAYVSGREFSLRTIAEFLAAIGVNVSAGYAFREIARALVGFVPVAGSLISASIAGGATVTLGKAAERYFIDD